MRVAQPRMIAGEKYRPVYRHMLRALGEYPCGAYRQQPLTCAFQITIPLDHAFHLDAEARQLEDEWQAEEVEARVYERIAEAKSFNHRC